MKTSILFIFRFLANQNDPITPVDTICGHAHETVSFFKSSLRVSRFCVRCAWRDKCRIVRASIHIKNARLVIRYMKVAYVFVAFEGKRGMTWKIISASGWIWRDLKFSKVMLLTTFWASRFSNITNLFSKITRPSLWSSLSWRTLKRRKEVNSLFTKTKYFSESCHWLQGSY